MVVSFYTVQFLIDDEKKLSDCIVFALLRSLIHVSSKHLRRSLDQSDANIKRVSRPRFPALYAVWLFFKSGSHRLLKVYSFLLIGRTDYWFRFCDSQSKSALPQFLFFFFNLFCFFF